MLPSKPVLLCRVLSALSAVVCVVATPACAQTTNPFPSGIEAEDGVVVVGVEEFATLPDGADGPARMMLLIDAASAGRLFVNDMTGPLYALSYDGASVTRYLDLDDASWGVGVESRGRERGFQSFAFHPDFGREGAPGYGRFYTWTDTPNTAPEPDFRPGGGGDSHDTVLLEWTARDPAAPMYDGGPPREILRIEQPFGNHNAGHVAFNPLAVRGDPEYGLLYVGVADGGSGGDPMDLAQDLSSAFGKVLRIDPMGSNSANRSYGIPAGNPALGPGALGEIWAWGVRNPQRFGWDPSTGTMYLADIGQNAVEELTTVPAGGNLGWNDWEGSFRFESRQGVSSAGARSDPGVTYPVAEYAHGDPLIQSRAAVTGVHVVRDDGPALLRNRVLFGDFPSGEIFHFDADDPPSGGNQGFRRVLLSHDGGPATTFLDIIDTKLRSRGASGASRADLRFGAGADGRVFLLNKHDGTIRVMTAGG